MIDFKTLIGTNQIDDQKTFLEDFDSTKSNNIDRFAEVLAAKQYSGSITHEKYIDWLQLATGKTHRNVIDLERNAQSNNLIKLGYYLNGTDAYVQSNYMSAAIMAGATSLDILMNVRPTGFTGSSGMFLGVNVSGGNVFTLNIDTTTKKFRFFSGADSSTTAGTIVSVANQNYKVRFSYVYSTNAVKVYVDDVLDIDVAKNIDSVLNSANQISFGQEFDGANPSDFFEGIVIPQYFKVDDVDVYDYTQDVKVNAV